MFTHCELLDNYLDSKSECTGIQTVSATHSDSDVKKQQQCLKELIQMSDNGLTEHNAELIHAQLLQ